MRGVIDKVLWGTLFLLFGPSVMIVASWNALPGDNLYGVKLTLEKAALAIASPSYATTGNLQMKYTERRYAEAKQLLASKQSIAGLPYLQQQIAQTKNTIENAPDKAAQVALAKQYINALTTVSTDLETQKQSITTGSQPPAYGNQPAPAGRESLSGGIPAAPPAGGATIRSTPTPTLRPTTPPVQIAKTQPIPSVTPMPTPAPIQIAEVTTTTPIPTEHAAVALQIDQAQQHVDQTIADLQALVDEDNHGRNEGRGRNENRNEDKEQKENNKQNRDDEDRNRRNGSDRNN